MSNPIDDGAQGVDRFFLWKIAIDAKQNLLAGPKREESPGRHAVLVHTLHESERDVVEATGLDLETVREVLDFAAAIPMSTPDEWVLPVAS
jgi:hypothetical protein